MRSVTLSDYLGYTPREKPNAWRIYKPKMVTHPNEEYKDAEGQEEEVAQYEAHHPEDGESHTDELILAISSSQEIPWLQSKEKWNWRIYTH